MPRKSDPSKCFDLFAWDARRLSSSDAVKKNLIVLLLTNNSSGNRRVIPSYVVWKIRKTFCEEGGLYIPYTEEWNNFYNVLVYANMKNKFF